MAARRIRPSLWISVDIEADGPVPGPYSMLGLGAAVADVQDADGFTAADPEKQTSYRELHPISEEFVPEAPPHVPPSSRPHGVVGARVAVPVSSSPASIGWVTSWASRPPSPRWLKTRFSSTAATQPVEMPESRTILAVSGKAW